MKSAWLSCALLLAACGSDSFRTQDPGIPLEEVPGELAETLCERQIACSPLVEILVGSAEQCAAEWEKRIRQSSFDSMIDAVDDGRVTYDGRQAEACLDAWENVECVELHLDPEACSTVFTGSVPRGGECVIDQECEGDSICSFDDSCPGACTSRLAAGEVCDGNDDRCAEGLVCSEATDRCARPGAEGDPCGGGVEAQCAGALYCQGEDDATDTPGECVPQEEVFAGAEGESCSFDDGALCGPGLSCVFEGEGDGFVCRRPNEDGSCRLGFPAQCAVGEYCEGIDVAGGVVDGTCAPLPGANEPCAQGLFCATGHVCREAECRALRENGQTCQANLECYSGYCVDGGCAPSVACE